MHGAGSPGKGRPGGVHKTLKAGGRYSKYLPTRLAARYAEAESDPNLISLRSEIALLDTRLADVLGRVQTGEGAAIWQQLAKTKAQLEKARASGDEVGARAGVDTLLALIGNAMEEQAAWGEVYNLIEQRRRVVDSEWKRLADMQQMITAERALLLITALTQIIKTHVTDTIILGAISTDIRKLITSDAGDGSAG